MPRSFAFAVRSLMKRYGFPVQFERAGANGGTYDPATGTVVLAPAIEYEGTGVFTPYDESEVDGTAIRRDDRKFLMEARSIAVSTGGTTIPEVGDVTPDSQLRVVDVSRMEDKTGIFAYVLQLRG